MGGRSLAKRKEREGGERNCSAARGAADERERKQGSSGEASEPLDRVASMRKAKRSPKRPEGPQECMHVEEWGAREGDSRSY